MTDKEALRRLMENAYLAHKKFKQEWANWAKYDGKFKNPEPQEVTLARVAFNRANDALFNKIWHHEKEFFATQTDAGIDYFISFCEIDIPAYRCGYAKQLTFRKLKSYKLNDGQKSRLRQLAVSMCSSSSYRIEIKELIRLMIKIADQELIEQLTELSKNLNRIVKNKSERMLKIILHHRQDLFENQLKSE